MGLATSIRERNDYEEQVGSMIAFTIFTRCTYGCIHAYLNSEHDAQIDANVHAHMDAIIHGHVDAFKMMLSGFFLQFHFLVFYLNWW